MNTTAGPTVSEVLPQEAWAELEASQDAVLIDVRTRAEWSFVGFPDLSSIGHTTVLAEWRSFPNMAVVENFADDLIEELGGVVPSKIFFVCRSGVRSMQAAAQVASVLASKGMSAACVNVAEGFEGDLNAEGQRGSVNGWKIRGLAWRQS